MGDGAQRGEPVMAWRRATVVLALVVAAVGALVMPKSMYRGDPLVMRMAASHLMVDGRLWFSPDEMRLDPPGFKEPPGRHFFDDADRGRFWSKFGVLDSLRFVGPMRLEAALRDGPLGMSGDQRLTLPLDLWSALATFALALYAAQPHPHGHLLADHCLDAPDRARTQPAH